MKNLLLPLLSLGLLLNTHHVFSQVSDSETVEVSIDLTTPVISLTVINPSVIFEYTTAEHYNGPMTVTRENHLTITSNTAYDVVVSSNQASFTAGSNTIPLEVLQVMATPAEDPDNSQPAVVLSADEEPVITGSSAGIQTVYHLEYMINDATLLVGQEDQVFQTTITYTATAQ